MKNRILVVDDESDIAKTLCLILEFNGYTATWAESGCEAIAKAEDYQPDVLVSDVLMPGLNGFEIGLRVKQHCPNCRLVFVTGLNPRVVRENNLMRALEAGGYEFQLLTKPVHPDIFLESVRVALLKQPQSTTGDRD